MWKKKRRKRNYRDKMKYEMAEELGLMEKNRQGRLGRFNSKESGRIGGLIRVRKREMKKKKIG